MLGTQMRVAAVMAIAGAALAACGSARYTPPLGPPATATPTQKAGTAPASGSRAAALRLAREMLASALRPPGSRPYSGPLPPELDLGGAHATPGTATDHVVWQVPAPLGETAAFIRTHGTSMASVPVGRLGGAPGVAAEQFQIPLRPLPAGIYDADMNYVVAHGPHGGSLVLAESQVIWYPARSAAEHVSAETRTATVTAQFFNPRPHTVTRTVTDQVVVARLAHLLNGMHAAPHVTMSCPAVLATYRVTFAPGGKQPALTASTGGCLAIAVTAGGAAQPALWDPDGAFTKAVSALTGNRA